MAQYEKLVRPSDERLVRSIVKQDGISIIRTRFGVQWERVLAARFPVNSEEWEEEGRKE